MTILQIRTNAPAPIKAADAMSLIDQAVGFVGSAMPKAIALAYFFAVLILLWRLFKQVRAKQEVPMLELIGVCLVFGLMRQ